MIKLTLCVAALCLGAPSSGAERSYESPADLYGELFVAVQSQAVLGDGKAFVDATPKQSPREIAAAFLKERYSKGFALRDFVERYFALPERVSANYRTPSGQSVTEHIDELWEVLTRAPVQEPAFSSRIALPRPYVVPGGRFREIYYWDSYFTMLGLQESHRVELISAMLDNFAYLIEQFGHIPNGNRTYYVSRSQPPFLAAMVELEAQIAGEQVYGKRLKMLRGEYAFWMDGAQSLEKNTAYRRVVRLRDGAVLNRYWDDRDSPREESYKEDVATARVSNRPVEQVYRNLRAAAESGWDFSSRWLKDGTTLATIRTVEIVPIDLNSLLYQLERTIAHGCDVTGDHACTMAMNSRAEHRRSAIIHYLWSARAQAFVDYDWVRDQASEQVTAATVYPLYFKIADREQAQATAHTLREKLLTSRGLATTAVASGQQWDAPNGWAPLQWLAIGGLRNYGHDRLASTIAQRWVAANLQVYRSTGRLVEKYDLRESGAGKGGEYPSQDGFGWTNGVLRKLLAVYPELGKPVIRFETDR